MLLLLRGVYYEGWSPANKPDKLSRDAFLQRIKGEWAAPTEIEPERCARAVFNVIQLRIGEGESSDVRSMLPDDIKDLWPQAA